MIANKLPTITTYSKEAIMGLLNSLISTQECIENSSEIFMRLGKENPGLITNLVNDWLDAFNQACQKLDKPKTLISFFYLANDIIQKCATKGCPHFKESFKDVLVEPFSFCLGPTGEKLKPEVRDDIRKVIDVWQDRKVYGREFLKKLYPVQRHVEEKRAPENNPHQHNLSKSEGLKPEATKKVPENAVEIPPEFVNFSQNFKTMRKWTEKSEENKKKLKSVENSRPEELDFMDLDCILAEYKRCLSLEQKYRRECLNSAKDILKTMENDQAKAVDEMKKVLGVFEQIEEIERRFLDNR